MHFFHQTLLYMTFEVAEPAWRRFQAALAAAATVEQVRTTAESCSKATTCCDPCPDDSRNASSQATGAILLLE